MSPDPRPMLYWSALLALFGADKLTRAFGKTPPEPWVRILEQLTDFQFSRGLERLTKHTDPHIPTVPQFLAWCRETTTADYVPYALVSPGPKLDNFDELANRDFLAYMQANIAWIAPDTPLGKGAELGPIGHRNLRVLLQFKKSYAEDLRAGPVPADGGVAWFFEAMELGKAQIARLDAQQAA